MPEHRLQRTRAAYDAADFLYYRFPWVKDYDQAICDGIVAAMQIHGNDLEDWLVNYYIAQAHRDRVDRQDREDARIVRGVPFDPAKNLTVDFF